MYTLDIKEINKDNLLVFLISHNFSISFGQLLKLYSISDDLFWVYINTLAPILKIGTRKISQLSKTASDIIDSYNNKEVNLTDDEMYISDKFKLFIADSFYDGTKCIHYTDLKNYKFDLGISKECNNYDYLKQNISTIETLYIGKYKYVKISRASYIIDRYYNNMSYNTINNMTIREVIDKIDTLYEKKAKNTKKV